MTNAQIGFADALRGSRCRCWCWSAISHFVAGYAKIPGATEFR